MVYIAEVGSEEKIPVPVDKDNSLHLETLDRFFPGAVGLYFEENGTEKIPVAFNETRTMLIPPDGDWSSRVFYVVYPRVSRPTTPSRVYIEDILPTVNRCRKYMLYTLITEVSAGVFEDGSIKSCVTVASSRFAFMAGHCLPKGLPKGKIFKVYDSIGHAYDVRLVLLERYENSGDDFAVVEVQNGQFLDFPSTIGSPYQGAPYFIFGYDSEYPNADLSYFKGTVRNINIYQFQNYIIGSPGTTSGCSGGGVFSMNGDLYGICVSGRLVTGSDLATLDCHFQTLRVKLSEPSYSHIVPGHYLIARLPNRKRKCEEIDTPVE